MAAVWIAAHRGTREVGPESVQHPAPNCEREAQVLGGGRVVAEADRAARALPMMSSPIPAANTASRPSARTCS